MDSNKVITVLEYMVVRLTQVEDIPEGSRTGADANPVPMCANQPLLVCFQNQTLVHW